MFSKRSTEFIFWIFSLGNTKSNYHAMHLAMHAQPNLGTFFKNAYKTLKSMVKLRFKSFRNSFPYSPQVIQFRIWVKTKKKYSKYSEFKKGDVNFSITTTKLKRNCVIHSLIPKSFSKRNNRTDPFHEQNCAICCNRKLGQSCKLVNMVEHYLNCRSKARKNKQKKPGVKFLLSHMISYPITATTAWK